MSEWQSRDSGNISIVWHVLGFHGEEGAFGFLLLPGQSESTPTASSEMR